MHLSRARQPSREAWSIQRLTFERSVALGMALRDNTNRAYSSHLNSYLTFCAAHHFPVEPTPDTLSYFVVYMSSHIQPRSVMNYLSGIVNLLQPFFPTARASRDSPLVCRTLRGCLRRFARPVLRKQPLSREDLLHAYSFLQHPLSYDDVLWLTQLFCGFYALLRLNDLVWPDSTNLRHYASLVSRLSVELTGTHFAFTLPAQKTDHLYEGDRVLIQRLSAPDDPWSLFQRYLVARDSSFPLHPYLWIRADGSIPTRSWFLSRLRRLFPPSIGGHSMRSGGATSLAAAGVPPTQIQAIGRWTSPTWQHYIRKHPVLLQSLLFHGRPLHASPFASLSPDSTQLPLHTP